MHNKLKQQIKCTTPGNYKLFVSLTMRMNGENKAPNLPVTQKMVKDADYW